MDSKIARFKVVIPNDKIKVNHELALGLIFIYGKAALHVIDLGIHFRSAAFLPGKSIVYVWQTFPACLVCLYTGYQNTLKVAQGSVFYSVKWQKYSENVGISLKLPGVESHNSLINCERYHEPLRRVYLKIETDYPNLNPHLALHLATKSMSDCMGPKGYIPSMLVFGTLPYMPLVHSNTLEQRDRIRALIAA